MDGVEFHCRRCNVLVTICQSCWRGQRYCGESCRSEAAREAHRRSQSRYASSGLGKANQKLRSRRQRLKKSATDETTKIFPTPLEPPLLHGSGHCWLCDNKVEKRHVFMTHRPVFSLRRKARDYHRNSS